MSFFLIILSCMGKENDQKSSSIDKAVAKKDDSNIKIAKVVQKSQTANLDKAKNIKRESNKEDKESKNKSQVLKKSFSGVKEVDAKNIEEKSALHSAVKSGDMDLVKGLIESGADVNKKDEKGRTPAYYSIATQNSDIAYYLFEEGADFTEIDAETGGTLLELIASLPEKDNSYELAEFLLGAPIFPEAANTKTKKPPLWYAVENSNLSVVKALINNSAGIYPKTKFDYKDRKLTIMELANKRYSEESISYNKFAEATNILAFLMEHVRKKQQKEQEEQILREDMSRMS